MNLSFEPLDLKLRHTFQIAREIRDVQNNIIVLLKDEDGIRGSNRGSAYQLFGEEIQYVSSVLLVHRFIKKCRSLSYRRYYRSPQEQISKGCRCTCGNFDMALHDFIGKKLKIPLYKLLGLNRKEVKTTSFTIGIDIHGGKMCKKVDEAKDFFFSIENKSRY